MSRWLRDWGPGLAWAVAIFLASSRSRIPVDLESGLDKVAHFLAYFLLGAALAWGGARRGLAPLAVAALGIAYGASDEIHQMFVPGRSPDVLDWFADTAGVAAAVLLLYPFFAKRAARGPARSRTP